MPPSTHSPASSTSRLTKTEHPAPKSTDMTRYYLSQLKATITRVMHRLEAEHKANHIAMLLQQHLETFQNYLANQTDQAQLELPESGLRSLDSLIQKFTLSDGDSTDAKKHSLVYPLRIAITQVFPQNRKIESNQLTAFTCDAAKGSVCAKNIHSANWKECIATEERLLHFESFVIVRDNFYWQDKLRAIYHAKRHGLNFLRPDILQKHPSVSADKNLTFSSTKRPPFSATIVEAHIDYYCWMIQQGIDQAHMLYWDEQLRLNKDLSALILLLCQYDALQEEKAHSLDPQSLLIREEKIVLRITEHPLVARHKLFENIESFEAQTKTLLSNLVSPDLASCIKKQEVTAIQALTLSEEGRNQLLQKQSKRSKVDTLMAMEEALNSIEVSGKEPALLDYEKLCKKPSFISFLEKIESNSVIFLSQLRTVPQPNRIIQYLLKPGLLDAIIANKQLYAAASTDSTWLNTILDIEKLVVYAQSIKKIIYTGATEYNPTLWELIEEYNKQNNGASGHINLSLQVKRRLAPLVDKTEEFEKILNKNPLARKVLHEKHNCEDLINTLERYSDLILYLQNGEHNKILSLADDFCKNADEEIILYLIEGGLSLDYALSLSGVMRNEWIRWYNRLLSILKSTYGVADSVETCKNYIAQRIPIVTLQKPRIEDIERILHQDTDQLSATLFAGLIQCEILSPDEILILPSLTLERFVTASRLLDTNAERIRKEGCNNPAEIIANIPALKEMRDSLDQLKSASQTEDGNKDDYIRFLHTYSAEVAKYVEPIHTNLTSIYATAIQTLIQAGISLNSALSINNSDRKKMKRDLEKLNSKFAITPILQKEKITDYQTLLQKIVEASPDIEPIVLFSHAIKVVTLYTRSSSTINHYYDQQWLTIHQVLTLTPQAYDIWKNDSLSRLSEDKYYNTCLQVVADLGAQKDGEQITHDLYTLAEYSRFSLLNKIRSQQNIESGVFVKRIFEYKRSDKNIYSEDSYRKRVQKVKETNNIIAKCHWRSLLANTYAEDTDNQQDFSLDHIDNRINQYLDNLESEDFPILYHDMHFSKTAIMHATEAAKENFFTQFESLRGFLRNSNLKLKSADTAFQTLLDRSIGRYPRSIQSVADDLATAHQTLTSPGATRLRQYKMPVTAIAQISLPLLESIDTCLSNIATLCDSAMTKEALYEGFVSFIRTKRTSTVPNAYEIAVRNALDILSSPMIQALVASQKYSLESILNNVESADVKDINAQLELIQTKEDFVQHLKECGYPDIEKMIIETIDESKIDPSSISDQLIRRLEKLNQDNTIELIKVGIKPIRAISSSSTRLHGMYNELKSFDRYIERYEKQRPHYESHPTALETIAEHIKTQEEEKQAWITTINERPTSSRHRRNNNHRMYSEALPEQEMASSTPRRRGSKRNSNAYITHEPSVSTNLYDRARTPAPVIQAQKIQVKENTTQEHTFKSSKTGFFSKMFKKNNHESRRSSTYPRQH